MFAKEGDQKRSDVKEYFISTAVDTIGCVGCLTSLAVWLASLPFYIVTKPVQLGVEACVGDENESRAKDCCSGTTECLERAPLIPMLIAFRGGQLVDENCCLPLTGNVEERDAETT